jgi:glycopeptide antibiotics resistance protein
MQFVVNSGVVVFPALFGWIAICAYLQTTGKYQPSLTRHLVLTTFVVYLLLLIHLTIFPIHVHIGDAKQYVDLEGRVNMIPFADLRLMDFLLNVAMTAPLGLFLPVVFRRSFTFPLVAAIGILLGASFEVSQYVLRVTVLNDRYVTIDDAIANAAGVLIAYSFYRLAVRNRPVRSALLAPLLK